MYHRKLCQSNKQFIHGNSQPLCLLHNNPFLSLWKTWVHISEFRRTLTKHSLNLRKRNPVLPSSLSLPDPATIRISAQIKKYSSLDIPFLNQEILVLSSFKGLKFHYFRIWKGFVRLFFIQFVLIFNHKSPVLFRYSK